MFKPILIYGKTNFIFFIRVYIKKVRLNICYDYLTLLFILRLYTSIKKHDIIRREEK